jgi:hypothetical protein
MVGLPRSAQNSKKTAALRLGGCWSRVTASCLLLVPLDPDRNQPNRKLVLELENKANNDDNNQGEQAGQVRLHGWYQVRFYGKSLTSVIVIIAQKASGSLSHYAQMSSALNPILGYHAFRRRQLQ